MNNRKKGNYGELIAVIYLRLKGYKIIKTNYLIKGGELDIIAQKKNEIVIIEVKTRKNKKFGAPEDAVGYQKKKNIIFASKIFLKHSGNENKRIRFDVISIVLKPFRIKHIKNAFFEGDVKSLSAN